MTAPDDEEGNKDYIIVPAVSAEINGEDEGGREIIS